MDEDQTDFGAKLDRIQKETSKKSRSRVTRLWRRRWRSIGLTSGWPWHLEDNTYGVHQDHNIYPDLVTSSHIRTKFHLPPYESQQEVLEITARISSAERHTVYIYSHDIKGL